jgi:hypothetical protein
MKNYQKNKPYHYFLYFLITKTASTELLHQLVDARFTHSHLLLHYYYYYYSIIATIAKYFIIGMMMTIIIIIIIAIIIITDFIIISSNFLDLYKKLNFFSFFYFTKIKFIMNLFFLLLNHTNYQSKYIMINSKLLLLNNF